MVFGRLSLSSIEHDIFALFLTRLGREHYSENLDDHISGRSVTCPQYTFTSNVLSEWFGTPKERLYSTLKAPSRRLSSQNIGIDDQEAKEFVFMPLFKKVEYRNGTLTLIPNDQLLKEYLCVSEGHSQIPHQVFRSLKKESSKRLYSMLCRFKDMGTLWEFSISDLQSLFGLLDQNDKVAKKTYAETKYILKNLIRPAIEEINDKEPDISFIKEGDYLGFTTRKEGKSIVSVKFNFVWKTKNDRYNEKSIQSNVMPEETSYELALQTYDQVLEKKFNAVDQQQLNNLMANIPLMKERFHIDSNEFLSCFSQAMDALHKQKN
tara:strand:+ start:302 stop:1264 length:963 start_codon:yes stop_codon:yes gene_type:complete